MRRAALGLPVLLVACSSPADIQTAHQAEEARYQDLLASANEWNTHVLGIPASGWLAIILVGSLMVFALLVLGGVWAYHRQTDRAADRMTVRRLDAEVRKAVAARETCAMCGYTLKLGEDARPE